MNAFRIRVAWPSGTYHGREWPPSPLRLYQAMLAGYRTARPPNPQLDAALLHLEGLEPPLIHAPLAAEQSPVAASVPNNDGDVILDQWAKGETEKAHVKKERLRTIRVRRPWRFDGPVTYTWRGNAQTNEHMGAITQLADSLTALGQGIDLAWASVTKSAPDPHALCYQPDAGAALRLTVPYPGVFDALELRYHALRSRMQGDAVSGVAEPDHREIGYRSELDPPARAWVLLNLHDPNTERTWSTERSRLMDVAAMTRHAIQDAATRAGLDAETVAALMGHRDEQRILIHPLPNVGHHYADGRIRRVLLSAPETIDPAVWRAVVYRLTGAALTPLGASEPVALLAPASADDTLLKRYAGQSTTWTTATPMVLPGHDHRRGKPRPQRTLARLLRHAGLPAALVEEATFEVAPRLRGSPTARECRLPAHLVGRPLAHATIRWRVPVSGPLALGAGVGYGFGVFSVC